MSCIEKNIIYQGQDQEVTIQAIGDDGNPIDMSTADNIGVIVAYKDGTVLTKFSMNAGSGWKDLDVSEADEGKVTFKVETDVTTDAREGDIYAEIKYKIPNVDYEDGLFDGHIPLTYIGTIQKSLFNDVTVP